MWRKVVPPPPPMRWPTAGSVVRKSVSTPSPLLELLDRGVQRVVVGAAAELDGHLRVVGDAHLVAQARRVVAGQDVPGDDGAGLAADGVLPRRGDVDVLAVQPPVAGARRVRGAGAGGRVGEGRAELAGQPRLQLGADVQRLEREGEVGVAGDLVDDLVVADLADDVELLLGVAQAGRLDPVDDVVAANVDDGACVDAHGVSLVTDGLLREAGLSTRSLRRSVPCRRAR